MISRSREKASLRPGGVYLASERVCFLHILVVLNKSSRSGAQQQHTFLPRQLCGGAVSVSRLHSPRHSWQTSQANHGWKGKILEERIII